MSERHPAAAEAKTRLLGDRGGFMLIELLVVIAIMGILLTIATVQPFGLMARGRDDERADDIANIARRLEQAYMEQSTLYGTASPQATIPAYPTTYQLLNANPSTPPLGDAVSSPLRGTMAFFDKQSLMAPGQTTLSLLAAQSTTDYSQSPNDANAPTVNQYIYQPFDRSGNLCTDETTQKCVRFLLYYRKETDNSVVETVSVHQQ